MRTSVLVRVTGGLAAALLGLTMIALAPASADEPALPVVVDDTVSLYPGQTTQVDVLANDSSPAGDDLALCRFPSTGFDGPKIPPVLVFDGSDTGTPGTVMVLVAPRARGTHVIDYYVCDHTHLVPAHLTVEVLPVAPVLVKKVPGKPGRLRVTNTNDAVIRFWYGDRRADRPDGRVKVPAGATRVVQVRRHDIVWIALIGAGGKAELSTGPGLADRGAVHHIKLRPGTELPRPTKHPVPVDRAWRTATDR